MTLETLDNYRGLVAEVNILIKQIENSYNTYHSPSFSSEGSGSHSDKSQVENAVKKIMDLEEEYVIKKNEMLDEAISIERWLGTVENPFVRACIRCHYLLGYTWKETTIKVFGRDNDGQNAKRTVRRYFGLDKSNNLQ